MSTTEPALLQSRASAPPSAAWAGAERRRGARKDLERLFAAIGVQSIGGPNLGIALTPEDWKSDTLTLEPGTIGTLETVVDDYLTALER